jgi:ribosomal protein S18 acetylase RimI-like enzyme
MQRLPLQLSKNQLQVVLGRLLGDTGELPMDSSLELGFLLPDDWRVLRGARLRALLDSPHAFTSSYAHESSWGEPEWLRMFDAARWIVAREAEKVIGVARSLSEPDRPATRHVESIWVAPTHRRRGVFSAMVLALGDLERGMGVTNLLLWVLEDNYAAQQAYEALGFVPTGERQFLPDFGRFERRMRLGIQARLESVPAEHAVGVHHGAAKSGQYPGFQLQEIHGRANAAHIADAV